MLVVLSLVYISMSALLSSFKELQLYFCMTSFLAPLKTHVIIVRTSRVADMRREENVITVVLLEDQVLLRSLEGLSANRRADDSLSI